MNRELIILNEIEEDSGISQRKLAKLIGCSLGTINSIMQKFVKNGLIEQIEINTKSVQYLLTEEGKQHKGQMTYEETINCYHTIAVMKTNVKGIIQDLYEKGFNQFYLAGEENEVYKLLKMTLIELRRELKIVYSNYEEDMMVENSDQSCVLFWEVNREFDRNIVSRNIFIT